MGLWIKESFSSAVGCADANVRDGHRGQFLWSSESEFVEKEAFDPPSRMVDHRKLRQESPADAGIPARRKNDEKNSSISKL